MPAPAVVQTSWLTVDGPRDADTCAWCARWVGRSLPVEMQSSYGTYHQNAAKGAAREHPCRCQLKPTEIRVDPEDPGCAWA